MIPQKEKNVINMQRQGEFMLYGLITDASDKVISLCELWLQLV